MKIFKRIIAVAVIVFIVLAVSYIVFTSNQINHAANQNDAFGSADTICENFRLSSVNARNYILCALEDCGQRGNAFQTHEISQAQNSREICELCSGGQMSG
jgi:hypothetical protein